MPQVRTCWLAVEVFSRVQSFPMSAGHPVALWPSFVPPEQRVVLTVAGVSEVITMQLVEFRPAELFDPARLTMVAPDKSVPCGTVIFVPEPSASLWVFAALIAA